ncbi:hypothetical protein Pcinc_014724 [Petrolisthes cinctipes]|uniref:Endonuclease/exonuclease/phosphatase domain-containing protein n=1 Tax=Petrolisthes cinctipes TaxID=88211 RepID=A0AAE1FZR9_PETCI|nr:hypothetical protein Pcinc_014724 [Petrolisthes cinctipes]
MSLEEESHRAIARPAELSGYTPQTYCSVCGKTTVKLPSHPCVSQHCVNSIHTTCLGTETEFDCSKVGSLRRALGITAPVSYVEETTSAPTHSSDTDSSPEDDLAHLLELQPSELVKVIRELRVELSRKNKLIRFYSSVSSNISGVRDAVVSVLDFNDNIAANHSSLGSLNTRTLASSACPDWIDKEWVNHVTTNQNTQDWWTSDNPCPLRSTTTAFPPGPRLACPPDQPVASVPGLDASTQLGPDAPSQTQPDSNTQGQPVSNTHQPGTAVPGPDPPGAASNSVQQCPNLSRHSHSAQLLIGNSGQQRAPKSSRIPFTRNSVNNAQRQLLPLSTLRFLPHSRKATGLHNPYCQYNNSHSRPILAQHSLPTTIPLCRVMQASNRDHLSILSANVRGLQTNIGDLIHSHVIPHSPDVVATVETFLNETIPNNYGLIQGYTRWHRRDRTRGTFGGVAVCFRKNLSVQPLDVTFPDHLEMMYFKIWTKRHSSTLLCVCYRPQWQGSEPIQFLCTHLDRLLQQFSCNHTIIVCDLNQHLIARSFEELLTVYSLTNHVKFPTHISGSSLDPVISDLPEGIVTCRPLGTVGSSDHLAVLTTVDVAALRDAPMKRTNWLWGKADWDGFQEALCTTPWHNILVY